MRMLHLRLTGKDLIDMEYCEIVFNDELYHHGVKGQKWGVRRYQNSDGSLTPLGKKRYAKEEKRGGSLNPEDWNKQDVKRAKNVVTGLNIARYGVTASAALFGGNVIPMATAAILSGPVGAATVGGLAVASLGAAALETAILRGIVGSSIDRKGKRADKKFRKAQAKNSVST